MSLLDTMKMDMAVLSTASPFDESDEAEYWRGQSHRPGMEALEFLRQVMYGYSHLTDRIPRVIDVIKRAEYWVSAHRWIRYRLPRLPAFHWRYGVTD